MPLFTWPSAPRTWVAGEVVTAPNLNDEIRDRMTQIETWLNSLPDILYPVGHILYNASVSTNPATLLGFGTWTLWGAGRVAVCVDTGQAEFDTLEETGGEKTHVLTTAEMPVHTHVQNAHSHALNVPSAGGGTNQLATTGGNGDAALAISGAAPIQNATATNQNAGGDGAHNNLQPYITVYAWKRVA